jgi:hypothetical protein
MLDMKIIEAIRLAANCLKSGVHEPYIRIALLNDGIEAKNLDSILLWAKQKNYRELYGV